MIRVQRSPRRKKPGMNLALLFPQCDDLQSHKLSANRNYMRF